MSDDRSAVINIGGQELELILHPRATKEIAPAGGRAREPRRKADKKYKLRDGARRNSLAHNTTC